MLIVVVIPTCQRLAFTWKCWTTREDCLPNHIRSPNFVKVHLQLWLFSVFAFWAWKCLFTPLLGSYWGFYLIKEKQYQRNQKTHLQTVSVVIHSLAYSMQRA